MLDTYRGGYLKALLDVQSFLARASDEFSYSKVLSKKGNQFVRNVLGAMMADLDTMIDYGDNIGVAYHPKNLTAKIYPYQNIWDIRKRKEEKRNE